MMDPLGNRAVIEAGIRAFGSAARRARSGHSPFAEGLG
jgi:hypothetical protein